MTRVLYCHLQHHNDTIIKTQEDFFNKICTSHFICSVCVWEWVGDRTELQYIDPHSYGRQRCVFLVLQGCSTGGPGAQLSVGWCLSLLHLISNFSGPQTPSGFPRASSAWRGFPYHILSATYLQLSSTILTELYNSSTPTQSPTRSLEWHVWSSSSGNNCHAVHMSLSSGASVYECTMGFFFTLSHFISRIPPTRFLSITDHWDVSLPSGASLWNGIFWSSRRSKYNKRTRRTQGRRQRGNTHRLTQKDT